MGTDSRADEGREPHYEALMGLQMNSPVLHHLWKRTQIATLGCKVNVISDAMQRVPKVTEIQWGEEHFLLVSREML